MTGDNVDENSKGYWDTGYNLAVSCDNGNYWISFAERESLSTGEFAEIMNMMIGMSDRGTLPADFYQREIEIMGLSESEEQAVKGLAHILAQPKIYEKDDFPMG